MSQKDDVLVSIARTIATYRYGEIAKSTPAHVERWANQFTPATQLDFLREFDHVMRQTFITKEVVTKFLADLLNNAKLAGGNPRDYWARANFLQIQGKGQSQKEMVSLVAEQLRNRFGLTLGTCGANGGDFIYLDDVLFTGTRVRTDLKNWIQTAPPKSTVHVILIALHTSGHFYTEQKLREAIAASGKTISVYFWRLVGFENKRERRDDSEVLWPAIVPADAAAQAYVASEKQYPLVLRSPGGGLGIFSSERGRQVLEQEFLIAGVKVRSLTQSPKDFIRPLGCSGFGVGFGSMIATYRNCPNNSPLAVWWGDPAASSGALHWYPLLPRKTYGAPENVFQDLRV